MLHTKSTEHSFIQRIAQTNEEKKTVQFSRRLFVRFFNFNSIEIARCHQMQVVLGINRILSLFVVSSSQKENVFLLFKFQNFKITMDNTKEPNDEECMSHFQDWFKTEYPMYSLRRKDDKPPFVCYHQLKDIQRTLFWEKCCNICYMAHVDEPDNVPKDLDNMGFCMECAVNMFINSNHCVFFERLIEYDPNKKKDIHCFDFLGTAQCVRIFLYIIGVPSIFKKIISDKTLFIRFIKLMMKSDIFIKDWIKYIQSVGKAKVDDNAFRVALERDDGIKRIMSMLLHQSSHLHFKWTTTLMDNHLFQRNLSNLMNKINPNHFCVYLSYLICEHSKVQHHHDNIYEEYKVCYKDCIYKYRDRISCGNKRCGVNYYDHKNKKKTGNKWYRCNQCKIIYYCSRKCQKYDWSKFHHKLLCNKLVS